jgi:hypothetical protein
MTSYAGGSLRFWVRSTVDLEVGIRSGDVTAGRERSKVLLSRSTAWRPSDQWQRACIPLALLVGPNPKADLSRIKVLVVVAVSERTGGTGGVPVDVWLDDVRWEQRPC